jgi:hypothetical protein
MNHNPVNPAGLGVKTVKTQLILNPECNKQAGGNADGKTKNVDQRINPVPPYTAQGNGQIIPEHGNFE